MYIAMMLFAERCLQSFVVILPSGMVLLNAKNAWRYRQSQTLALLLLGFASCRPDWLPISHASAVEYAI
jgi:hypothetical protein